MKRLKRVAYIGFYIFMAIVIFETFGVLASGKRFAHQLSLLERSEAIKIVTQYLQRQGELYDWLGEEQIEYYVNDYLDKQFFDLTVYDKFLLGVCEHRLFKLIGKFISVITIVLLIWLELWSAKKLEEAVYYGG